MTLNPTYQSYVLRFWRDSAQSEWRAGLQCTATGDKFVFSDTAHLFDFLKARLEPLDEENGLLRSLLADETANSKRS